MISYGLLRDRIGLGTADDGQLKAIADALIGVFETQTNRLWARRAGYVEYFRPDTTKRIDTLFLSLWPVEAVTKVEEKCRYNTTWTELTTSQYLPPDPDRNRLERVGSYWNEQVRVTYTGGYVYSPTVGQYGTPAEIHEAMLIQAAYIRSRTGNDKLVLSSQNFMGGAGVFLAADFHPIFKAIAEAKRRKV